METFNRLMDIVMTYMLGLREYEGQYYVTMEDDIIYNITAYERRSDKQQERIEAAKVVITGFLNK